ncbi:MAG: TauD/TfdA family dioxygenase [Hormoscilla sp. GM7CHS1pb]|nr:TauD/TfdA family dioxygenase [Hormoscilla sp. GM7CHS1pb]
MSLIFVYWYSDRSDRLLPSRVTILHGIEVLQGSGDTLFADLRTAYEEMPSDLKVF